LVLFSKVEYSTIPACYSSRTVTVRVPIGGSPDRRWTRDRGFVWRNHCR